MRQEGQEKKPHGCVCQWNTVGNGFEGGCETSRFLNPESRTHTPRRVSERIRRLSKKTLALVDGNHHVKFVWYTVRLGVFIVLPLRVEDTTVAIARLEWNTAPTTFHHHKNAAFVTVHPTNTSGNLAVSSYSHLGICTAFVDFKSVRVSAIETRPMNPFVKNKIY
jgi:hypothetical protein